jgi:hypothetical protein
MLIFAVNIFGFTNLKILLFVDDFWRHEIEKFNHKPFQKIDRYTCMFPRITKTINNLRFDVRVWAILVGLGTSQRIRAISLILQMKLTK